METKQQHIKFKLVEEKYHDGTYGLKFTVLEQSDELYCTQDTRGKVFGKCNLDIGASVKEFQIISDGHPQIYENTTSIYIDGVGKWSKRTPPEPSHVRSSDVLGYNILKFIKTNIPQIFEGCGFKRVLSNKLGEDEYWFVKG